MKLIATDIIIYTKSILVRDSSACNNTFVDRSSVATKPRRGTLFNLKATRFTDILETLRD